MNDWTSSQDGTRTAYTRRGTGPPVVLVGGGLDDGSENEPLAVRLADDFTVVNYPRAGRGARYDHYRSELARLFRRTAGATQWRCS
jgi:hypothetical protein